MSYKRTIQEALDLDTGNFISATDFFTKSEDELFRYRRALEDAMQGHGGNRFVCIACMQPLKIRGGAFNSGFEQVMHFAHIRNSDDCEIKTGSTLSEKEILQRKFNGAKESKRHIELKNQIGYALGLNEQADKGVSDVIIDKVYKSEQVERGWRKPDVRCFVYGQPYVFEIQLATTFLSVIAEREHFYRQEKNYITWIFQHFHTQIEKQLFTEKDIFYSNRQNVFVFDADALTRSETENDLVLHCYYRVYELQGDEICFDWKEVFVKLSELQKDETAYKLYYYDSDADYEKAETEKMKLQYSQHQRELRTQALEAEAQKRHNDWQKEIRQIELGLTVYRYDKSKLIDIFKNLHSPQTRDRLLGLIRDGYLIKEFEKKFLAKEFEEALRKIDRPARKHFAELLAMMLFYYKHRDRGMAKYFRQVERLLYAILGLKRNVVIGYNFHSHLNIAHDVLDKRKGLEWLFIRAMKVYGRKELILFDDSSGKLQRKIEQVTQKTHEENHGFDVVFQAIFPELFM